MKSIEKIFRFHPAVFAALVAVSAPGQINNQDYKIIFIGSGTEDNAVNGGRALHAAFTDKGVKHTWSEDPGYGHDYQIWRRYLHTLLQKTFRD